jgi:hypothetical protein
LRSNKWGKGDEWIELAMDSAQWQALVNMIMDLTGFLGKSFGQLSNLWTSGSTLLLAAD